MEARTGIRSASFNDVPTIMRLMNTVGHSEQFGYTDDARVYVNIIRQWHSLYLNINDKFAGYLLIDEFEEIPSNIELPDKYDITFSFRNCAIIPELRGNHYEQKLIFQGIRDLQERYSKMKCLLWCTIHPREYR